MPTASTALRLRLFGLIVITALLGLGVVINLIRSPHPLGLTTQLHD